MDTKKWSVLLTCAECGSFTKAAEATEYTQSGLTHMMDGLEREIGFAVLERGHGGVRLTPAGKQLLPYIKELLRADERLAAEMRACTARERGSIRIAAYSSMAMQWMPEILYRFRRERPDVTVDLRMVDHALEPFELLESGGTDVIFAAKQDDRPCNWTPLYDEPLYAILPKRHPLSGAERFPVAAFAGCEFLMPYGRFDQLVREVFEHAGVSPEIRESRVDDETVIRMVGSGLGVSLMAELMIRGRTDDVRCVPLDPPAYRELGMGTRRGESIPESVRVLKECVLAFLKKKDAAE
ncbi:MAG: LysR family transcriptional regulator [Clostridia bacterium]|nr:LysR family transcriptional regulator [Clostridia bacterium]